MKRIKQLPAIALLMAVFCSCQKEELPVPKHESGDVITSTVNLDPDYKWQIFYDLNTNTVVSQNRKTTWDLGFETSETGYRIVLNTSKAMFVWDTNDTSFTAVDDTVGFNANRKWDETSGNLDSTAFGDWRGTDHVYVIDRGFSETGAHQGFRKIQVQSVDADKYQVRFSQLNGTGETTMQIPKDTAYNFTFLSFNANGTVAVEPPKHTWDLLFTQYTHIFYDVDITPYLVTGCLLNRYETTAAKDSISEFSAISFSHIPLYTFSSHVNTIGYDWKEFSGSTYTTNDKMNYLIKDSEGYYYKLHFIDFYNQAGVKGNPTWEYQEL